MQKIQDYQQILWMNNNKINKIGKILMNNNSYIRIKINFWNKILIKQNKMKDMDIFIFTKIPQFIQNY